MANGDQAQSGIQLPPELLATVAEAIGAALAKPTPNTTPAEISDTAKAAALAAIAEPQPLVPGPAGKALGAVLAPVAAPVLAKAANKFKCPTLWVAIGTIAGLFVQNPLGLQLHPATQMAAAAVAAIYVAAQAIVDSAQKGGGNG